VIDDHLLSAAEDELIARCAREMEALTKAGAPVVLELSPVDAYTLLSQIQVALRHPENKGPTAEGARRIARQIEELLAPPGSAMREMSERGWRGE
jgi:hypothetical protein